MRARESPPPDTATAAGQGGPSSANTAAKWLSKSADLPAGARCAATASLPGLRLFTASAFARFGRAGDDRLGGVRVFRREGGKSGTTFLFLTHRDQRLCQLQHTIRRPGALRIFLDLLREGAGRRDVILLHIGDIADPIHCLWRQLIARKGVRE